MKLEAIKEHLPEKFYKMLEQRIQHLTPAQEKAIKAGLLKGESILVCSPTASGKTLIAELAALKAILEGKGKAIYNVPLKALASEKFNDFKKYEQLGLKVALSTGDLDSADNYLSNYDLIICSNEKLDSLIRHHADWLTEVAVVIIDEVHLLHDIKRGPTLEVLITMLKSLLNAQFIALSATIGNPEELADWLDAKLVEDNWRPVKLYEGISLHNNVDFFKEKDGFAVKGIVKDSVFDLAIDTIQKGKQALVFVSTKKSAETVAENLSKAIDKFAESHSISINNSNPEMSSKILHALSSPTTQCKKLADCARNGVAFHHSGLAPLQRNLIEAEFKAGKIKIICCTTTLSLGLEFPTDRVIVKDLRRFGGYSQQWIPVLEVKQFVGRAGRPSYHTEGEAIYIAKTEKEKEEILERYINGEIEEIYSKLAVEPVLRMYILSLIAIGFSRTREQLLNFFEKTFWAYQYEDMERIEFQINRILDMLKKFNFIYEKENKLIATNIGLRVAQLYIDPLTAHRLIFNIEKAAAKGVNEIAVMHAICEAAEMRPLLNVRQSEEDELQEELLKHEEMLYAEPEFIDDDFLEEFKTAMMLTDWLNERTEEYLLEKYRIRPGEFLVKVHNVDWLLYSFEQLALLLEKKEILAELAKLRVRLKYGAKEELLALLRFKNIGRVRARLLFNANIKNRRDVKEAGLEKLASVLRSKEIAKQLKEQVEIIS